MSVIKEKARDLYHKLTRYKEPVIKELPDFDASRHYERSEYVYLLYMFSFFILLVIWITQVPNLVDLLLVYYPSIGPIPGNFIVNVTFGLALLLVGLLIRQARINYEKRLSDKANAYPWITGTLTEMTEQGFTTKHFQLPIEDIRPLARSGDEVQLWGNPGVMTIAPNDQISLFTVAYLPDDHIIKQFPVVHTGSVDDHLALKRFEDVFVGWLPVNIQVSKIHFVVPTRIQDQRPVMYVGHSAITVEQILNRQTPKIVDDEEIYASERLYALTYGERLKGENLQQRARIQELEQQNIRYQRELVRKENQWEQEQSVILTPEQEKVPILNLTGWKMYAFYGLVTFAIIAIIFFGGSFFGFW